MPEEADEHKASLDGVAWRSVVGVIDQKLRDMAKYQDKETANIEELRAFIRQELDDDGLQLP